MTSRACVIGWPIKHSRSPLIHNHWIAEHRLDAHYGMEAVTPEDFPAFAGGLAGRGYVGANVTLPHKEAALAAAGKNVDARARAVGAANTLYLRDGKLHATNTDVEGFMANLLASVPAFDGRGGEAVVLGAGGSARAVIFGLIEHGLTRVHVVNRTVSRAQDLRDRFGAAVMPAAWEDVPLLLPTARLLVNTTSLGMAGQPPLSIDLSPLRKDAAVADLVYAPLTTPLLAAAREKNLATADGLGMLLHQAVRGFSLWFGVTPQVTPALRKLVEADLAGT